MGSIKKNALQTILVVVGMVVAFFCALQQEEESILTITDYTILESEEDEWDDKLCAEWNTWLKNCKNKKEKEIMLAAFAQLEEHMEKGSVFRLNFADESGGIAEAMYSSEEFPNSGYRHIRGTVDVFDSEGRQIYWCYAKIDIIIQEDGTYQICNNYNKYQLAGFLEARDIKYEIEGYSQKDMEDCVFICFSDWPERDKFWEDFHVMCCKIADWQEKYDVDLSQKVRFGEAIRHFSIETDFSYQSSFRQEHMLDFAKLSSDKEAFAELQRKVEAEQLAYMKAEQPERYDEKQEEYISIDCYSVPSAHYSIDYDRFLEGFREGGINGLTTREDERYKDYLFALIGNSGKTKRIEKMEWPEYTFSNISDEFVTYIDKDTGEKQKERWKSEFNDYYGLRFPFSYTYGSCFHRDGKDCFGDMVFQGSYLGDVTIRENREWDKGRLYLFAFPGMGPEVCNTDDATESAAETIDQEMLSYLEKEEVQARIEEACRETVNWNNMGQFAGIYENFFWAEGETTLRKVAVCIPQMREEEDFHWVILIEEFKDSGQTDTLYQYRDSIMQNFVLFPYWYECRQGDTLWKIAEHYTGDAKKVGQICKSPENKIENPDLIQSGQKIFLAPHLLIRKK